jgi:hypothetical protein
VQIPVFIALYWVLLASVELRHAPFFLWIDDLARPDTLFGVWFGMPIGLLPILMGATMIIQTRLNPEPPDPVQAKVMKIMPLVFSIFFFFFPAGLVLYLAREQHPLDRAAVVHHPHAGAGSQGSGTQALAPARADAVTPAQGWKWQPISSSPSQRHPDEAVSVWCASLGATWPGSSASSSGALCRPARDAGRFPGR